MNRLDDARGLPPSAIDGRHIRGYEPNVDIEPVTKPDVNVEHQIGGFKQTAPEGQEPRSASAALLSRGYGAVPSSSRSKETAWRGKVS